MSKRVLAVAGLATTMAVALGAPAASASHGPPPPISTNGHKVQLVASGLHTPTSFAFGHGRVFVGDGGSEKGPPNGGVYVLRHGHAIKIASALKFVAGLAFHNNKLYISGGVLAHGRPSWRLLAWSGWNGRTFTVRKTLFVAGPKFQGWNGIGFGANGRLYAGVDVGLLNHNDHGPATTSPHVYQILTFRPNGTDMRVFAKGIRQPWQMAFQAGSNAPFVTDLGQDSGATNPPDFVLHVHAGDDYGFPGCNHTVPANCQGFAAPFRTFRPHTDLMGIAVRRGTLYLTSFLGRGAKGPGGAVFTLGLNSHVLKPLLKRFVAPTVGLGLHNGYVYVGELTGQVYRVRI
jgi:glucose/arabinose dehydrogenase